MAIDVIEAQLICSISDILNLVAVSTIFPDLVTSMTDEFKKNRAQRKQLIKQLQILTKNSDTYKRFIDVKLFNKTNFCSFHLMMAYIRNKRVSGSWSS